MDVFCPRWGIMGNVVSHMSWEIFDYGASMRMNHSVINAQSLRFYLFYLRTLKKQNK